MIHNGLRAAIGDAQFVVLRHHCDADSCCVRQDVELHDYGNFSLRVASGVLCRAWRVTQGKLCNYSRRLLALALH